MNYLGTYTGIHHNNNATITILSMIESGRNDTTTGSIRIVILYGLFTLEPRNSTS